MSGFKPAGTAYRSTADATHSIPLRDSEPPYRLPELEFGQF
jgi:hypothetical protein